MICLKARYAIAAAGAILLALGPLRADAGEMFVYEPLDWRINIPDGWEFTPEHIAAEVRETGRDMAEAMLGEDVKGDPIAVLSLHSNGGTLTVDAIDFIESRDGPFADSTKLIFDMALHALDSQGALYDHTYTTFDIGGVEFSALEVALFAGDRSVQAATYVILDGLIEKTGVTMGFMCLMPADCSDIREALSRSKFGP